MSGGSAARPGGLGTGASGKFGKLRDILARHGPAGFKPTTDIKENARLFIEELRKKNAFMHESGKPVVRRSYTWQLGRCYTLQLGQRINLFLA